MSSPLEFIRHGIQEADWSLVTKGFSMMTGEKIKSPKGSSGMMDILRLRHELVDAIDKALGNPADVGSDEDEESLEPADEQDDSEDEQEEEDADEDDEEPDHEPEDPEPEDPEPGDPEESLDEGALDETPAQTAELAEPETPPRKKRKVALVPDSIKALLDEDEPWRKFEVEPGQITTEKGRQAKKLPLGKMGENKWRDDHTIAADDIAGSKKLSKKLKGRTKEVRPPVKLVSVKCSGCGKMEEVEPILVPRPVESGDDTPQYRCNRCICRGQR